jgi:hypothetical protein
VAGARCRNDALDRLGGHAQVERDEDQSGAHRPEIGRRQLLRRGRPGQQPVAGLEAKGPQPPGGRARPTFELAVGPVGRRPVVEPQAQSVPVAIRGDGIDKQVEQGVQGRASGRGSVIVRRGHRLGVSSATVIAYRAGQT